MPAAPSNSSTKSQPVIAPVFFTSQAKFRSWLRKHHQVTQELWVGFYKRASGKPSLTWPESVDVALCYGWIDGVRKSIDATAYTIRFTPRKPRSTWSSVNVRRIRELTALGLVQASGLQAFERRSETKSGIYAYENRDSAEFADSEIRQFKAHPEAWKFFQAQAPWYRRTATWWAISAKKEQTRQSRLDTLIRHSGQSEPIPQLRRKPKDTSPRTAE
jgi:uncharacterized protein YdeI (YjbR/CyaY-like superfamily)